MSVDTLIPPDEKDAYECIGANRMNLYRFAQDFAESVAVFSFLERGDDPPSAGVRGGHFAKWRIIAARDGALNIYHFGCSLDALKKQLPTCPTLNRHIDSGAIREAARAFRQHFPNTRMVRHAIAHAGEMQSTPSKMRQHWQRKGGLLIGSIHNRTYSVGYKGEVFSVTLDEHAIKLLQHIQMMADSAIAAGLSALAISPPHRGD